VVLNENQRTDMINLFTPLYCNVNNKETGHKTKLYEITVNSAIL